MGNVKFRLNLQGLNELMKSAAMQGCMNSAAASIASAAGTGFEAESAHSINFIAIAGVRAATYEARKRCNEDNTLLKAAGGARV